MALAPKALLCSKCKKANGILTCVGCQSAFCIKDWNVHRQELSKEMGNVANEHDILRQQLNGQTTKSSSDSLMKKINEWEQVSIEKIKQVADQARKDVCQLNVNNNERTKKNFDLITNELKLARDTENYSEIDLDHFINQLNEFKQEAVTPTNIIIDVKPITCPAINVQLSYSNEKFGEVNEHIRIEEDGLVAVNLNTTYDSKRDVWGTCLYSTGIHRIRLKIEAMQKSLFVGITSKSTPSKYNLTNSIWTYGWEIGTNAYNVYLGGSCQFNHASWDGGITQNDTIELTFNCNDDKIQLINTRAGKPLEIKVNTEQCPRPWQLLVGFSLGGPHRVRILN